MIPPYPGAVAPERTRRVRSQRIEIHVSEWGDAAAPPLVCTHGAYDHARGFELLAPLLADDHRVIAIDQRGHGDSDWADAYGWMNDVLDLVEVVRDVGTPVFLLGHSKGGGQATDAAALMPDRVRRLVNLDGFGPPEGDFTGPGSGDRPSGTMAERMAWYLDWRRQLHDHPGFRVYDSIDELAMRRQRQNPRLSMDWLRRFTACGSREVEGGYAWKVDPLVRHGFGPFKPAWIAPSWQRVTMPVLALYGAEDDTWALPEALRNERLAYFPKLDHAAVPDAGHFVHMEQPKATAGLIRDFLKQDPA